MTILLHESDPRFLKLIGLVLNVEGGYSNHPNDPGGPTNHGIAYNYNVEILRELFNINSPGEIRRLTVPQAKEIYYRKYWTLSECDKVLDLPYAYIAFDCAVNQGPGAARSWISQKAFVYAGDGKNIAFYRSLRRALVAARNKSYARSKRWDFFGWGWMNRMCDVSAYAERISGEFQVVTVMLAGEVVTLDRISLPPDDIPPFPIELEAAEV